MKYIRTKEGIFTLITRDEPFYELNGKKYYCVEERVSSFSKDEIIKQADTIEELCDEFVVIATNWKEWHEQYISLDKALDFLKEYDYEINKNVVIYAAIWTEWGLKYVAKMNEKGELELL